MSYDDYANGKMFGHTVRMEAVVVDAKKVVQLYQTSGQIIFRNNEIWTIADLGIVRLGGSQGSMEGRVIMIHPDGSVITTQYEGQLKAQAKSNRTSFAGKWEFVSGTGRVDKIQGGGTYKGSDSADKYFSELAGTGSKAGRR